MGPGDRFGHARLNVVAIRGEPVAVYHPPPYEGAYLLRCGAKAKPVTQGLMGRAESYY